MPNSHNLIGLTHLPIQFQATALEMIHDIREAFNELLEENDWMDPETRKVAEDKGLDFVFKIFSKFSQIFSHERINGILLPKLF